MAQSEFHWNWHWITFYNIVQAQTLSAVNVQVKLIFYVIIIKLTW